MSAIVLALWLSVAGAYPAGQCQTWAAMVRDIAALAPIEQARLPGAARILRETGRLSDDRYALVLRALAFVRLSPSNAYALAQSSCPQDLHV